MSERLRFFYPSGFSCKEKTKVEEERREKKVTEGWQSHREMLNSPASLG